jgi:hypothetical protein
VQAIALGFIISIAFEKIRPQGHAVQVCACESGPRLIVLMDGQRDPPIGSNRHSRFRSQVVMSAEVLGVETALLVLLCVDNVVQVTAPLFYFTTCRFVCLRSHVLVLTGFQRLCQCYFPKVMAMGARGFYESAWGRTYTFVLAVEVIPLGGGGHERAPVGSETLVVDSHSLRTSRVGWSLRCGWVIWLWLVWLAMRLALC